MGLQGLSPALAANPAALQALAAARQRTVPAAQTTAPVATANLVQQQPSQPVPSKWNAFKQRFVEAVKNNKLGAMFTLIIALAGAAFLGRNISGIGQQVAQKALNTVA